MSRVSVCWSTVMPISRPSRRTGGASPCRELSRSHANGSTRSLTGTRRQRPARRVSLGVGSVYRPSTEGRLPGPAPRSRESSRRRRPPALARGYCTRRPVRVPGEGVRVSQEAAAGAPGRDRAAPPAACMTMRGHVGVECPGIGRSRGLPRTCPAVGRRGRTPAAAAVDRGPSDHPTMVSRWWRSGSPRTSATASSPRSSGRRWTPCRALMRG